MFDSVKRPVDLILGCFQNVASRIWNPWIATFTQLSPQIDAARQAYLARLLNKSWNNYQLTNAHWTKSSLLDLLLTFDWMLTDLIDWLIYRFFDWLIHWLLDWFFIDEANQSLFCLKSFNFFKSCLSWIFKMLPNIMYHLKAKTHNVDSPLAIHLMQKEKCLTQSVTSLNFNSSRMAFVKCVYSNAIIHHLLREG